MFNKRFKFQVIISLTIVWVLCGILTATGTFEEGNKARIGDVTSNLDEATWFYFPYPGKRKNAYI